MATPNDHPSGSIPIANGPYWGMLTGTTIGADIDGGEVWDYDARNAWYHWPSLPAGTVYVHVRPDTAADYFEAALIAGSPTAVTEDDDWIGYGFYDVDPDPESRQACMLQANHAGGPLTLVIFVYDGDGDCDFTIGWGHTLDADPTHWSTESRSSAWFTSGLTIRGPNYYYPKAGSYRTATDSDTFPPSFPVAPNLDAINCSFDNARIGAVGAGNPCVSMADGGGDWRDAPRYSGPIGQAIETVAESGVGVARFDTCTVSQNVMGINCSSNSFLRRPLTSFDGPDEWYDLTHDELDQWTTGLYWGWLYAEPLREVGPIELEGSVSAANEDRVDDVGWTLEPCTAVFRYVPPGLLVNAPIESETQTMPNVVWTKLIPDYPQADNILTASYLTFDALGAEMFRMEGPPITSPMTSVTRTASVPIGWREAIQPHAIGTPGDFLILCAVAAEALDGDIPSTPPMVGPLDFHFTSAAASILWLTCTVDFRTPDYLIYIGFPLPPRTTGGWHIGRMAVGAW